MPHPVDRLKMYILIRESVPIGFALVGAAHAALAAYLKFADAPETREWLDGPFYKTICKVTDEEFENAKSTPGQVLITESALRGQEVALAFQPRRAWPDAFRYLRLYR